MDSNVDVDVAIDGVRPGIDIGVENLDFACARFMYMP